jgi:hypothetical protein
MGSSPFLGSESALVKDLQATSRNQNLLNFAELSVVSHGKVRLKPKGLSLNTHLSRDRAFPEEYV